MQSQLVRRYRYKKFTKKQSVRTVRAKTFFCCAKAPEKRLQANLFVSYAFVKILNPFIFLLFLFVCMSLPDSLSHSFIPLPIRLLFIVTLQYEIRKQKKNMKQINKKKINNNNHCFQNVCTFSFNFFLFVVLFLLVLLFIFKLDLLVFDSTTSISTFIFSSIHPSIHLSIHSSIHRTSVCLSKQTLYNVFR